MEKVNRVKKQVKITDFIVYALMKLGEDRWSTIEEVANVLARKHNYYLIQSFRSLYTIGAIVKRKEENTPCQYKLAFSSVHVVESLARVACLRASKRKMSRALLKNIEKLKDEDTCNA